MKATYTNPEAAPWTRRDEVRQRLGNCARFIYFAWLALRTDSTLFAAVFINSARSEGDLVIGEVIMRGGRKIEP